MKNIAVITGASSGLGIEYAKAVIEMYRDLDEIWLIARRKNLMEKFADQHSNICIKSIALDLSNNEGYAELKEQLFLEKPNIKVLINNAGYERNGRIDDSKESDILEMIDLNVKGVAMVDKVCIPYMHENSIVTHTCSASAFNPMPGQAVYSASKVFVKAFGRALHEEMSKKKIKVLTMCPGNMDTPMNKADQANQRGKKDPLPYLNMEIITRRSLKLAEKGKSIYTPGLFYKGASVISKILPSAWMVKIVGHRYVS